MNPVAGVTTSNSSTTITTITSKGRGFIVYFVINLKAHTAKKSEGTAVYKAIETMVSIVFNSHGDLF